MSSGLRSRGMQVRLLSGVLRLGSSTDRAAVYEAASREGSNPPQGTTWRGQPTAGAGHRLENGRAYARRSSILLSARGPRACPGRCCGLLIRRTGFKSPAAHAPSPGSSTDKSSALLSRRLRVRILPGSLCADSSAGRAAVLKRQVAGSSLVGMLGGIGEFGRPRGPHKREITSSNLVPATFR